MKPIPCRNKIVFRGKPSIEMIQMCNSQLQNYMREKEFEDYKTYTLQASSEGVITNPLYDITETVKFGEQEVAITRNFETFHQNDDGIRQELYKVLADVLSPPGKTYGNVLFIGGECYLFSKVVQAENIYCFSDDEKILRDCLRNNDKTEKVKTSHVDYNTVEIPELTYDLCILNVSKKGLGEHLSYQVRNSSQFTCPTYYISCHAQSFQRDNLSYTQKWDFSNSLYTVSLYLL